ncbi:MAG: glycoside hydrolase family 9 protein [Treponemataceae bacterium]|nr:glycoside hydrolase family 9 protein [Treponemataceae bacterium]
MIYYCHEGYPREGSKFAIYEYFPHLSSTEGAPSFYLIDREGKKVFEIPCDSSEVSVAQWKKGMCYLNLDFSSFQQMGLFAIVDSKGQRTEFFTIHNGFIPSAIDDLIFYFRGQRCSGVYNRTDYHAPLFQSTEYFDVHGGWYDAAGDYSKYLSHLAYSNFLTPQQTPLVVWTLFQSHDLLAQKGFPSFSLARIAEEAFYGADFLVRMQHPEGYFFITLFDRWSHDPAQRELCAYETQKGIKTTKYAAGLREGGGLAIAALARAATLARRLGVSGDYESTHYLKTAEKAYAHLKIKNREYVYNHEENLIDYYCALMATTELYNSTGTFLYRDDAFRIIENIMNLYDERGFFYVDRQRKRSYFHGVEEGLLYISILRFLQIMKGDPSFHEDDVIQNKVLVIDAFIQTALRSRIELTEKTRNPFLYPPHYIKTTPYRERILFFMPHINESGYWWQGENARLASLSAAYLMAFSSFCCREKNVLPLSLLKNHAEAHLYWIFGCNPFDTCMMQGRGHNNPSYELGFPNAPGGVCNGITSHPEDEEDIAFLPLPYASDGSWRWRWSEQWLPHGAWLLLALASYYYLTY